MRFLIAFLLLTSICYAQEINEKYSYKDLSSQSLKDIDTSEFNNSIIIGSAFGYPNQPNSDVFPDGMTGVTFRRCNLVNTYIPEGNTIEPTSVHFHLQTQTDAEDWIMEFKEDKWVAKEPLNKDKYLELDLSIDPKDLPDKQTYEPITEKIEREARGEPEPPMGHIISR